MRTKSKSQITNNKIKLKKGDLVEVMVGKDKGKRAKIERVFPKTDSVLLPEINQYKKHRKSQGQDRPGEILTLSRPLVVSKVALVCPKCKQTTRIGWRLVEGQEQKRVRYCRKCDQKI